MPEIAPAGLQTPSPAAAPPRLGLSRVAEITVLFWVVKVLTTAMGETTSDYLVHRFGPALATPFVAGVFAVALVLQFRAHRYRAWNYWFAVAMVGVFGTMAADSLHAVGIPYIASTSLYAIVLTVVFVLWNRSEHTLSIHSIRTRRREVFYWATVLATFALGTAAGDLTATTFGLGHLGSAVMFSAIIAVPAIGYLRFGLNPIVAFWSAYIVTRPLGASFADWMAGPTRGGGLGWGTGPVSVGLILIILALVAYLAGTPIDQAGG